MSVPTTTENGLRAGNGPFEMGTVSTPGMVETAQAPWRRRPKQGQGLNERI